MKKASQKIKKQERVTKKNSKASQQQKKIYIAIGIIVLILGLILTLSQLPYIQNLRTRAQLSIQVAQGLHVQGNKLVDAQGNQVILHGVNRSSGEYTCVQAQGVFSGPVDQNSVNAMKSWNINAVRIPLNEDCWLGINGAHVSTATYQQAIVQYVNLLNQNNMYVILDLHWNYGGATLATGQQDMADLDHSPAFWTSVAQKFKGNDNVLFDLYNEPHGISWSCWKNGGCNAPFAIAGMDQLISAVRSTGATNIVLAGGLQWANDLTGWLANKPNDPLNNLMANAHIYNFNACNNTSCWNSQIAPVAAQVPLTIDEGGEKDCTDTFINQLMPWADSHNIGYLFWQWNPGNCAGSPSLTSDTNGTPTAYGIGLKKHLASLPQTPTLAVKPTTTPPSNAPTAPQPTAITPTFGALGDCQTIGTCPTPTLPAPTHIVPPTQIPSSVPSGTQQSPSLQPTQSGSPSTPPSQNPGGNNQGIIQLFLQFIQLLLQLLSKLF